MRSRFSKLSIETKLQIINMATTAVALVLVLAFLLAHEFWIHRQSLLSNLQADARMIASNASAAVLFRDQDEAAEILAALQASPSIVQAIIYLPDHKPFARYSRSPYKPAPQDAAKEPAGSSLFAGKLEFWQDIQVNGEKIGDLFIEADPHGLYRTILRYFTIILLSAVIALLLAFMVLQRLKPAILAPLQTLAELMRKVSRHKDYSLRSPVESADEVGSLAQCFNEMLEQIQHRDRSLREELSERRRAEEHLDRLAYYDTVTGLPNRHYFNERLAHVIGGANSFAERTALMFIDLDNFKIINDTLGHAVGDMLLQDVGGRLKALLRSGDYIFRIGGDEFAVILEKVEHPEDCVAVAEKIIQAFAGCFTLDQHQIFVGASIGISFCPDDATEAGALLKNADTAMYSAKERGKNTFQFFQPEMKGRALNRLTLENSLRRALERSEFVLYYQPQFDLESGRITGMEALIRWRHPELGTVSPSEFIPIAEDSGLIVPLGEWVLRTACAQAARWQADCAVPFVLGVNISGRQFKDDVLVDKVLQIVLETGMDPRLLELELTESTLMDGSHANMRKLMRLRAMGIRFSIDDFGTGYSSMSYLKRFPISTLKIDRSFVDGIPDNHEDVAITTAIIAVGKSLSLELLAEGVESRQQAEFLQSMGCTHIQGNYFSKPLPVSEASLLLLVSNGGRRRNAGTEVAEAS